MVMAARGYKTKKELKEAVGKELRFTETSAFGSQYQPNGVNKLVGPTTSERKWYATVICKDGIIIKVV